MAGDWIKMRVDLREDPTVFKLAESLEIDELHVIGCLFCFWAWADKHAVDAHVDGATSRMVDKVAGILGFATVMQSVGWLVIDDSGVTLPNYDRHSSTTAKERALKSERQSRYRLKKANRVDVTPSTPPSTDASTREEKRREELIGTDVPVGKAAAAIPSQAVVDVFHETLPELPKVKLLSDSRKRVITKFVRWVLTSKKANGEPRATTNAEALEWIKAYFERAKDNDFLMGRGQKSPGHQSWECDIDFLLSEKGMKQVLEKTRN